VPANPGYRAESPEKPYLFTRRQSSRPTRLLSGWADQGRNNLPYIGRWGLADEVPEFMSIGKFVTDASDTLNVRRGTHKCWPTSRGHPPDRVVQKSHQSFERWSGRPRPAKLTRSDDCSNQIKRSFRKWTWELVIVLRVSSLSGNGAHGTHFAEGQSSRGNSDLLKSSAVVRLVPTVVPVNRRL
jgi:hypothetical protein